MHIAQKPWKQFMMPESIWDKLVRMRGEAVAYRMAEIIFQKRQAAAAAARAAELRLAAKAARRGPQVAPLNDIGWEAEYAMSKHSFTFLHTDKEAVQEGGRQNDDYMRHWLKKREWNKRPTAMHGNRKGWSPEVDAAVSHLSSLESRRMANATQIIMEAAGKADSPEARLARAAAEAPTPSLIAA